MRHTSKMNWMNVAFVKYLCQETLEKRKVLIFTSLWCPKSFFFHSLHLSTTLDFIKKSSQWIYIYIYIYIYVCVCVCVCVNLSVQARYDTRSIFKRSLTDLNSEFSFSLNGCHTKVKESSLPYYLPIAGSINTMLNANSRIWTQHSVSIS